MTKRLLPKAYAALLLYLATLPLFILLAAALAPERMILSLLQPIPALVLTGGAGLLPPKRRTTALVLSILLIAAVCAALFLPGQPAGMALLAPCLLVMLLFLPAMARPAHQEWTMSLLGYGVGLHVAAQFIKDIASLTYAAAPLMWATAAYLVVFLFSFNRSVLMSNDPASAKPLLAVNRLILAILCILGLLLTNIQAVATAVRTAIQWIIAAVLQAVFWLLGLFAPQGEMAATQEGGNALEGLMDEVTEPSLFARIMEIVLTVVALILAAVVLFFALRALYRVFKKLLRNLLSRLQAYRQRISADYVDQSETLLDWNEIRQSAKARIDQLRQRYMPTPWEKLSPAQRVRRVYALLLRRPKETPSPASTAQETLSSGALKLPPDAAASLAVLYDRARYSDHPISAQEADALRKQAGV